MQLLYVILCNKTRHFSLSIITLPRDQTLTMREPSQLLASISMKRLCCVPKHRENFLRRLPRQHGYYFERLMTREPMFEGAPRVVDTHLRRPKSATRPVPVLSVCSFKKKKLTKSDDIIL